MRNDECGMRNLKMVAILKFRIPHSKHSAFKKIPLYSCCRRGHPKNRLLLMATSEDGHVLLSFLKNELITILVQAVVATT